MFFTLSHISSTKVPPQKTTKKFHESWVLLRNQKKKKKKTFKLCVWFTPVRAWETETERRLQVRGQPGLPVSSRPASSKENGKELRSGHAASSHKHPPWTVLTPLALPDSRWLLRPFSFRAVLRCLPSQLLLLFLFFLRRVPCPGCMLSSTSFHKRETLEREESRKNILDTRRRNEEELVRELRG